MSFTDFTKPDQRVLNNYYHLYFYRNHTHPSFDLHHRLRQRRRPDHRHSSDSCARRHHHLLRQQDHHRHSVPRKRRRHRLLLLIVIVISIRVCGSSHTRLSRGSGRRRRGRSFVVVEGCSRPRRRDAGRGGRQQPLRERRPRRGHRRGRRQGEGLWRPRGSASRGRLRRHAEAPRRHDSVVQGELTFMICFSTSSLDEMSAFISIVEA